MVFLKSLVKSSETYYIGGDVQVDKEGTHTHLCGGGYSVFNPSKGTADVPKYYYYTKDHLGNIRNVLTQGDNGQMEEVQHTGLSFGGIIADLSSGRGVQNRFYNGKELDYANNLYWLDYGARQYDPTRGQFTTPDPLAEKYYGWNMYGYCMNNPVRYIDPDGRLPFLANIGGAILEGGVELISQVSANYLSNTNTQINRGKVGVAAAEGFVTCGGGTVKKIAVKVGSAMAMSAIDNYKDGIEGIALGTLGNLAAESGGAAVGKTVGLLTKNKTIKNKVSNQMISSTNKMTKKVSSATGFNRKTSRKVAQGIVKGQKTVVKAASKTPERITASVTKVLITEQNKMQ